eukprot:CAMPEP_0178771948 /NCGR_PEP_ID=MMETSP0744-20121128/22258_1 /TAXON_ID=913974 /ORGANISM="Nitzschia punctata, Strain CCMP561" /LENGTH=332 /DNA_ID=CAMNT_0020428547 /DNA_START=63 /DNA_END=1061 /DNA_ORIENTATION=+
MTGGSRRNLLSGQRSASRSSGMSGPSPASDAKPESGEDAIVSSRAPADDERSINLNNSFSSLNFNDSTRDFNTTAANAVDVDIKSDDPLAVKAVVRANRRRNLAETYTQPLRSMMHEDPDIRGYLRTFDLTDWADDAVIALAKYPDTLAIQYEQFVLSGNISQIDFWCRYFFKCDEKRILQDLRRKERLGILGQSSRNLMSNPNAPMSGGKVFGRGPSAGRGFGGGSSGRGFGRGPPVTGMQRGNSFSGSSNFVSKPSMDDTASMNGSYSSLVVDKSNDEERPEVSRANSTGDSNRASSLKEKLKNWNQAAASTNATERARRYRNRRSVNAN